MDTESLVYLVNFNAQAMGLNLEGITHEDSLVQPPRGNCLNWVVGHLLVHRNKMLEALGEPPALPPGALKRYDRGSEPITGDGPDVEPMERLLEGMASSKAKVVEAIQRAGDDALAKPSGQSTVGKTLLVLSMHEAYHVGQMGLLRRIAGKERAIN
ncbi:MAG TPA: DinB family protein [Thermoanaerobaculia bacterium]|nr:DinB family protein [Thermoanaerobaculia bacterium]